MKQTDKAQNVLNRELQSWQIEELSPDIYTRIIDAMIAFAKPKKSDYSTLKSNILMQYEYNMSRGHKGDCKSFDNKKGVLLTPNEAKKVAELLGQ